MRAEIVEAPEVGVQVESRGLVYGWPYEGGRPREEEVKEEPEEDEAAMLGRLLPVPWSRLSALVN